MRRYCHHHHYHLLLLLQKVISLVCCICYCVCVCVCVCRLFFVRVFSVLSSDLLYQVTVPGAVLLSQKTWHKTQQLGIKLDIGILLGIKLGIGILLGIFLHCVRNAEIQRAIGKILVLPVQEEPGFCQMPVKPALYLALFFAFCARKFYSAFFLLAPKIPRYNGHSAKSWFFQFSYQCSSLSFSKLLSANFVLALYSEVGIFTWHNSAIGTRIFQNIPEFA